MTIKINEFGFLFDTSILYINFSRSGIIALVAIYAALKIRKLYKKQKNKIETPAPKRTVRKEN